MSKDKDMTIGRRAVLASMLASGAAYSVPAIATLGWADPAMAGPQSSQSEDTTGQPETPGAQGQGPSNRPAEPGDGGRGRNSGNNPVHDEAQSSDDGGGGEQSSDGDGGGAEQSTDTASALEFFDADDIGPGFA